jgi:hypothetical protein
VQQGVPIVTEELRNPSKALSLPTVEAVAGTAKVPRDVISRLAGNLGRSKNLSQIEQAVRLKQVINGEAFADEGERDTVIYQLAIVLAAKLPHASPTSLAEHFVPSLQLMALDNKDPNNPCPTSELVADKIERAQIKVKEEAQSKAQQIEIDSTIRIRNGFRLMGFERSDPYTQEEVVQFSEQEGCLPEDFQTRWVIRKGNSVYLYGSGKYTGPYVAQQDAGIAVDQLLAPAEEVGVKLYHLSQEGKLIPKGLDTITRRYGTLARSVIIDMTAQRMHYDQQSATLIEAPFPLRTDIEPEYSHEVDLWLECIAAEKVHLLRSWIADLPNLQYPSAVLFLFRAAGAGKSFFADGIASIFNQNGPTDLDEAMQNWNDIQLQNPILFGDEKLPLDFRGRVRTEDLRQLIQAREKPLKRKFLPIATLKGSARILLAANNENMLMQSGDLTTADINAISERFILMRVSKQATEYLKAVPHRHWIVEDIMAKHFLWLYRNYQWTPNGRFRHRDTSTVLQTALTVRTGARFGVCMWLCKYLKRPAPIDALRDNSITIRQNRLFVRPGVISEKWDTYIQTDRPPLTSAINRAVTGLSSRRVYLKNNNGTGRSYYRQIEIKNLVAWAEDNDEMTEQEINFALSQTTPEIDVSNYQ